MIDPDELLRLQAAATPGPWSWQMDEAFLDPCSNEIKSGKTHIASFARQPEAAFIVAACNNAKDMAEEVKALKKALDLLVKWNFPVYSCLECPARETCDKSDRPCIAIVVEHAIKEARSGRP